MEITTVSNMSIYFSSLCYSYFSSSGVGFAISEMTSVFLRYSLIFTYSDDSIPQHVVSPVNCCEQCKDHEAKWWILRGFNYSNYELVAGFEHPLLSMLFGMIKKIDYIIFLTCKTKHQSVKHASYFDVGLARVLTQTKKDLRSDKFCWSSSNLMLQKVLLTLVGSHGFSTVKPRCFCLGIQVLEGSDDARIFRRRVFWDATKCCLHCGWSAYHWQIL